MVPIAVNFHITKRCNSKCRFCFIKPNARPEAFSVDRALGVIAKLADAGCEKITFVGGEPTLCRYLGLLLKESRRLNLVTGVVTNGYGLDELLDEHAAVINWVGLSVDSGIEAIEQKLGRGHGNHIAQAIRLSQRCHALNIRLKLNTVVTALNWQEDMTALVKRINPARWKVFQVLLIRGQNDQGVKDLLITAEQFKVFVAHHRALNPIAEDNEAMKGSYIMIDPQGRFFGNAEGTYVYSDPITQVEISTALRQVGFDPVKFKARGGKYTW